MSIIRLGTKILPLVVNARMERPSRSAINIQHQAGLVSPIVKGVLIL
jgi:hypothetical protein